MKKGLELNDYIVLGLIILFVACFCYSCGRTAQKAQQAEIEKMYMQGYEEGYADGENGNPYDDSMR